MFIVWYVDIADVAAGYVRFTEQRHKSRDEKQSLVIIYVYVSYMNYMDPIVVEILFINFLLPLRGEIFI